jgi:hypothetical protein
LGVAVRVAPADRFPAASSAHTRNEYAVPLVSPLIVAAVPDPVHTGLPAQFVGAVVQVACTTT